MPSVEPQTGITISYDVTGAGRALALVHGITEHRGAWGGLVDRFVDAGYRVLAIDLRGHGESSKVPPYDLVTMAGDLAAVLAAEDATDALLVGHSLGGAVVSACAASAPCRGVVNVDQPLALSAFKDVLAQLEPALRGSPSQFDAAITAIFDSMAGALAGAERARIEGLRGGDQDVVLGVWDVVLTSSAAELDATIDAVAAAIEVPCLSLHGIDPGEGYSEWLTSRIASATVEIWPEAGHYPHLVEPARFVDRVTEFDVARCRG